MNPTVTRGEPPQAPEAEREVLNTLILDAEALGLVEDPPRCLVVASDERATLLGTIDLAPAPAGECAHCGESIEADPVVSGGLQYHLECWEVLL